MRVMRTAGGRRALGLRGAVAVLVAAVLLPVAAEPSGAGWGSPAKGDGYEQTLATALTEIEAYWFGLFPVLYGARYEPVREVIAGGPGVELPTCQGQTLAYDEDIADNALYCYRGNFIAYDDAGLFPELHDDVGPFAVTLVLAHEWGHAVQDRTGNARRPSILRELQADCFAGSFTRATANGETDVAFRPGDLEVSIAALIRFRDAPGTSPEHRAAHGSAFDRVNAFQEGFDLGPSRCAAYFEQPPTVVEVPFTSPEDVRTRGNVPAPNVVPLTVELLNEFYEQVEPAYVARTTNDVRAFRADQARSIPRCGRSRPARSLVSNRVYYCVPDDYFAFDAPFLDRIYTEVGDFGVATLLANPWATYVQTLQGIPGAAENTPAAVLQADCYTGGWSAVFFNGVLTAATLSPGDLDEFVQAFLVYSRARNVDSDVPITFVRLAFFRRGFFEGYPSCAYPDIAAAVAAL